MKLRPPGLPAAFRLGACLMLGLSVGFGASLARPAHAGEIMTDRCSAEVAFVPQYDARPGVPGTIIMKRGASESSAWTQPFVVQTGDSGHIRWWCHSTTGNALDPGTWRLSVDGDGVVACLVSAAEVLATDGAGAASLASCAKVVKIGSSAFKGWTPERSRCDDHSTLIRARLGPDRLLQTECLGQGH